MFAAPDEVGLVDPSPATATLTFTPINDAPLTTSVQTSGLEDAIAIEVDLAGTDVDGSVVAFVLASLPASGTLYTDASLSTLAAVDETYPATTANMLALYYVPGNEYSGTVSFTFAVVDDGGLIAAASGLATVNVVPCRRRSAGRYRFRVHRQRHILQRQPSGQRYRYRWRPPERSLP